MYFGVNIHYPQPCLFPAPLTEPFPKHPVPYSYNGSSLHSSLSVLIMRKLLYLASELTARQLLRAKKKSRSGSSAGGRGGDHGEKQKMINKCWLSWMKTQVVKRKEVKAEQWTRKMNTWLQKLPVEFVRAGENWEWSKTKTYRGNDAAKTGSYSAHLTPAQKNVFWFTVVETSHTKTAETFHCATFFTFKNYFECSLTWNMENVSSFAPERLFLLM